MIPQLLKQYPIISDQISATALGVVLRELDAMLERGIAGDIAEFGCYIGTTSLFIRRVLNAHLGGAGRQFYAYDSFKGLPSKSAQDSSGAGEQFKDGELAVSKKQFLQQFQKAGLAAPITNKGWFSGLTPTQLPNQIAYAFLDGDFYDSILDSLKLVWPRLAPGGSVTIDDYQRDALPGVERAVKTYFHEQTVTVRHEHHIAIIH